MKVNRFISNNKSKYIFGSIVLLIVLTIYFLSIGFSTYTATGTIENIMASVKPQASARITGIFVLNADNGGVSNSEEYNIDKILGTIELPNENSSVTYKVDITVFLGSEMILSNITGLNERLDYEISNYTIGDVLCNDNGECTFGATKGLYLTIKYKENGYDSSNIMFPFMMDFTFITNNRIAKVGSTYFDSLQTAINSVKDSTETTIYLLNDTSEVISLPSQRNIILNLQGHTLSNKDNNPVISNKANLNISNGFVTSDAATNGAINNEEVGTITLSGVNINVTGGRQALYNNKGVATINDDCYFVTKTTERATVQNLSGGTLNILGGTIISNGSNAVNNAGTMTIGTKDGNANSNIPYIRGVDNGVYATSSFTYYDGILLGINNYISDESKVSELENGYGIIKSVESINGVNYKSAFLDSYNIVKFNPSGGVVLETQRNVQINSPIGDLPIPTKSGNDFDGWYTASSGGNEITSETIISSNITVYAHWIPSTSVARIGDKIYDKVQLAINDAPDKTQTTIKLLKNVSENLNINSKKDIVLDIGEYIISNSGNNAVITNSGNLSIINGTITSNADTGAINQNEGNLKISGGRIIGTGSRQAVYITGGITEISNDAYLSSKTYGKPNGSSMERGTIQCLSNGTLIITGGTIIGEKQHAVSNEGNLTIGIKDGNIVTSTPVLIGKIYGIKTTGTFNFFDGVIRGETDAIYGNISSQEDNSQIVNSSDVIDNITYQTAVLQ